MLWLLPALAASVDAPVHTGMTSPEDYAVVIGVEDYAFLPDVPHARADAQAVRTWLQASRGVPPQRVELLLDASKEQIDAALTRARQNLGDGTLWVYWAGHGAADPADGSRLLLGVDTMADPEVFSARAVRVDDLEAALASVPEAVLWLDTCYAGTGRNSQSLLPGTRFAVPSYAKAPASGGLIRWTAAGPGQLSSAHPSGHGAFTWASLTGLQGAADGAVDGSTDGVVTAGEAQAWVERALAEAGIRSQTPSLEGDRGTRLVEGVSPPAPPVAAAGPSVPMPSPTPRPAPSLGEGVDRGRLTLLTALGVGSVAALGTAVATRNVYQNAPASDGDLQGLVVANQVAGWTGIGLGAGFLVVGTQTVMRSGR